MEWYFISTLLFFTLLQVDKTENVAGKREITEKTFEYDSNTIPTLFATYVST